LESVFFFPIFITIFDSFFFFFFFFFLQGKVHYESVRREKLVQ
jgi:hypothetical protein